MPKRIVYWDGVVASQALIQNYAVIFTQLLAGDYKSLGLDLKKLSGYRVYSVRINDANRLLFTTVIARNGKRCLLLLDVVNNHDYQKSPFLKKEVMRAFMETKAQALVEQASSIEAKDFQSYDQPLIDDPEPDDSIEMAGYMSFYNNQFIQFNDVQQQALQRSLPLVVSGAAGSGKSCVGLSMLTHAVERYRANGQTATLLFISQSQELVTKMAELWQALPAANAGITVEFKTSNAIHQARAKQGSTSKLVGKAQFDTWMDDYSNHYKKQLKSDSTRKGKKSRSVAEPAFLQQSDLFYQEFRTLAAYREEDYLNLGQRQSLFDDKTVRTWLYQAFKHYQAFLEQQQQQDPALFPLTDQGCYDLIIVDEAQDLSHVQLKSYFALSKAGSIAYLIDSHQSLTDTRSKRPFLATLIPPAQRDSAFIELPGSYRCPSPVIHFANEVLAIKFSLTGGISDKLEPVAISAHGGMKTGSIQWEFPSENAAETIRKQQSAGLAVITQDSLKENARKLFGTPLVYTPQEIKGLEYSTIVVYELLSDPLFYQANTLLAKQTNSNSSSYQHRPKNNSGDEYFAPPFNCFFTALTRTTNQLIIIQQTNHQLLHLTKRLQQGLSAQAINQGVQLQQVQVSTAKDWQDEALRLLKQGYFRQAKDIVTDKLLQGEEEYRRLYTQVYPQSNSNSNVVNTTTASFTNEQTTSKQVTKTAVSASKKPQTTEGPSQNEKRKYLLNLLDEKNFTASNLKNLFDNKSFETYMFDVLIDNQGYLYIEILEDERKYKIFTQFLAANPKLAMKITAKALCQFHPEDTGPFPGLPPLYCLCASHEGGEVFSLLLSLNPDLAKHITGEALNKYNAKKNNMLTNTSALYWLSRTRERQLILTQLIKENPNLARAISGEALCRARPESAGKHANTSALWWLVGYPEGQQILNQLLKENSSLAKEISVEVLCRSLPGSVGVNVPTTLYWLCGSSVGRNIFAQLLKENHDLAKTISGKSLCKLYSATDVSSDTSALYWLSDNKDGRIILAQLLQKNPSLATTISGEALCKTRPELAGNDTNMSVLWWLSSSHDGRSILAQLLNFNPNLAKTISGETLCKLRLKTAGDDGDTSALYWLSGNTDGRNILSQLFKENSNLAKEISGDVLCKSPLVSKGVYSNTSALWWLSAHREGRNILTHLLKNNPNLAKTISGKSLCKSLTDSAGFINANTSTLYYLSAEPQGRELLNQLFTLNASLAPSITKEAWLLKVANIHSPWSKIMETNDEQNLLRFIPNNIQQELSRFSSISARLSNPQPETQNDSNPQNNIKM